MISQADALGLVADEKRAAGFMLQELPASVTSLEEYQEEDEDAWRRIVYLGSTITQSELLNLDTKDLLHRLFYEEDVRLFDAVFVRFSCTCSRERIEVTLKSLGYEEVHDILEETGIVEVDCHFCNEHYEFDAVDIEQIFAAGPPFQYESQHHWHNDGNCRIDHGPDHRLWRNPPWPARRQHPEHVKMVLRAPDGLRHSRLRL